MKSEFRYKNTLPYNMKSSEIKVGFSQIFYKSFTEQNYYDILS